MGRLFLLIAVLITALFVINDTVLAQDYIIADIQYEITQDHTNVLIGTNQKTEFLHYVLENPYRIVIDLMGVVFCELEQKIEPTDGPVKSIDIVKDNTIKNPEGLDEYFYAVDYIIIELKEKYPFLVFSSKDGKIIIAKIKAETAAEKLTPPLSERQPLPAESTIPKGLTTPPMPIIIEELEYEVNPQSSIIALISNKELKTAIYEEYNPYRIIIAPAENTFCELEERMESVEGLVNSISILKDTTYKESKMPDDFLYAVKNIVIEPIIQMPFTIHTADEGRMLIVRLEKQEMPHAVREVKATAAEITQPPQAITGEIAGREMPSKWGVLTPDEKQEMIDEITKNLYKKQEELFARKEQEEQRKRFIREARDKAKAISAVEKIGVEQIEDMVVKGEGMATLKLCQDTALSYSEAVSIAEEETKLSKTKVNENLRALFPNVKLKGSETTGDVLGTDFIERVYGVEADYPLYQGGRLWNTYKQSKVNLDLSNAKYDKVVHDLNYKIAEAYFSVVTSVMNLKLQKELLKKVEDILRIAQNRHSSGLSTDLELLNVKSQYNQVEFQLASAERDLALARFKLEQTMGLDIAEEKPEIGEVETDLKFDIIDIDLNKCIELAQEYHPDILVNELLVESNEYEEKIARGKDKFKVDLTGFYGRSGSHYITEADKMYKDWNIGVKVSKPFWGNTATYSFTKEETKRKVGQTDRQETEVHSGEFAILDSMNIKSGMQEAQLKKHKAENDLLEARRQINLEVKEAYYNYQEAIIQVKNSLEKARFQQEAVKTAKAQAQLNEALQSQLLEAEIKLADERSLYIKALSDHSLSLAKLNKAVGIENYFSMNIGEQKEVSVQ